MVTISCIIPVYNAGKYLRACLGSVLAQTFKDYEVILVNDGSTDSSEAICNEYVNLDSRVKLINKENGGVSSARNLGIEVASGQFVCFIDADDVVAESYFEKLVSLSLEHDCISVAGKIGAKASGGKKGPDYERTKIITSWRELGMAFNRGVLCSVCSMLYLRRILVDNDIRFDVRLRYGEDQMFNIEYFAVEGKVLILNQVVYFYLVHDDSSFHRFHLDGALENWILWLKRFLATISRDDISEKDKRDLIVSLYLRIHTDLIINACSVASKKDVRKEIAQVEEEYAPLVQVSGKEKLAYLLKSNMRDGILWFLTGIRAFWVIRLIKQVKRELMSRS